MDLKDKECDTKKFEQFFQIQKTEAKQNNLLILIYCLFTQYLFEWYSGILKPRDVESDDEFTETQLQILKSISQQKEIAVSSRKVTERHNSDNLKKLSIFSDRIPIEVKLRVSNASTYEALCEMKSSDFKEYCE